MHQIALFPELCRPVELCSGAKRLLGYLLALRSIRGEVFPFQRTLARKLGVCVRTVQRWLSELIAAGRVKMHRRGPTSALYFVEDVASNVVSKPPVSFNEKKQQPEPPNPQDVQAVRSEIVPETRRQYDEPFEAYIGVFVAAGKQLNDADINRAYGVWRSMSVAERNAAGRHVIEMCVQTQTQFIPFPINHLRNQPWTRVGVERTLPYRPPLQQSKIGRGLLAAWEKLKGEKW